MSFLEGKRSTFLEVNLWFPKKNSKKADVYKEQHLVQVRVWGGSVLRKTTLFFVDVNVRLESIIYTGEVLKDVFKSIIILENKK